MGFFDAYDRFYAMSQTDPSARQLNARYEAIIGQNIDLLRHKRVTEARREAKALRAVAFERFAGIARPAPYRRCANCCRRGRACDQGLVWAAGFDLISSTIMLVAAASSALVSVGVRRSQGKGKCIHHTNTFL